jgi:hypothetical protein
VPPSTKPPTFEDAAEFDEWDNCYDYARDLPEGSDGFPGDGINPLLKQGEKEREKTKEIFSNITCKELNDRAVSDGMRLLGNGENKCPPCYHMVQAFLKVRGESKKYPSRDVEDQHWFRQDSDGTWSHKRGGARPTNKTKLGKTMKSLDDIKSEALVLGYGEACDPLCAPDRKLPQ